MSASAAPNLRLKPGRHRKLRSFYPWVQREEVAAHPLGVEPGEVVRVVDEDGAFVALASYSPKARFVARVLSLEDEPIDAAFFRRRFEQALARRGGPSPKDEGRREVFSEADLLPGLIVDRYGEHLVVQVRNQGMERARERWLAALLEAHSPAGVLERSDMEGRLEEGLERVVLELAGSVPESLEIDEDGLRLAIEPRRGPKTGYYLDQRANRAKFEALVRPGEDVLDLFCFTGGFALRAARAGARVRGVDVLPEAVAAARENAARNGLEAEFEQANAFDYLQAQEPEGRYNWIVLDPPAIAKSSSKRASLKWAIWKLVYHGLPVLRTGGRMLVCNCAYQLGWEATLEAVRLAASDRGRRCWIEAITTQSSDHPYLAQFPESLYLKCLWVRFE